MSYLRRPPKPPGYSKALRRRFTRYWRRLEPLLEALPVPSSIRMNRETWSFLRSVEQWAPWLLAPGPDVRGLSEGTAALLRWMGGVPIVLDDSLEPGRFVAE